MRREPLNPEAQPPRPPPALECRNLGKSFPGVRALSDVSLVVGAGELHALVGENGAGKSTLVKIIAGQLAPDEGELLVGGRAVTHFTPQAARATGVTMVPQHPDLFSSLTALENLFVGDWPRAAGGAISWTQMRKRAEAVLAEIGADIDLDAIVASLSVAERQILQIARALLAEARVMIFDEPTAPLGEEETRRLFGLIGDLHSRGITIIYISHRLAEVFELTQRVTVLRDGALVATVPIEGLTRQQLVAMMAGESCGEETEGGRTTAPREPPSSDGAPLLQVQGLAVAGKFSDVGFTLRPGEIVGIAGVAGSGRSEVLRALAGVDAVSSGEVALSGEPKMLMSPQAAVRAGISFVPADRHHEALVLPMTVRENMTLGCLRQYASRLGLVRRGPEAQAAQGLFSRLGVRGFGIEQTVETLSGGNQQKVALASRLATQPRVLLLEEPTQGVDVGARAEIHRLMRGLAGDGVGILLVSSDLPELLALSDRVLVMHRGRIVGEFLGAEANQQEVLNLALGTGEAGVKAAVKRRATPVRELGLAALLAVLMIAISIAAPGFAGSRNLLDLLVNNSYMLIAAAGMTLVILTAGIDISVGAILGVTATLAAAGAEAGWPVIAVLAVALGSGLGLGAINAGLITAFRIPPIIATLATLTLFRHILIHFTGGRWINLPEGFRAFGLSTPLGMPMPVWIATFAAVGVALFLRYSRAGRCIYAVGSNPQAAEHVGISVDRTQRLVYLAVGALVGLAAFVYAGRWSTVQTNAGVGFEMVVITAVVVGGADIFGGSGTIVGTVLGVLLLGVISSSLTYLHVDPAWEKAFQGALILVAVVVDTLRRRGVEGR